MSLFYKQLLPIFTRMLQVNTSIKVLRLEFDYHYVGETYRAEEYPLDDLIMSNTSHFCSTLYSHPSLYYVNIGFAHLSIATISLRDIFSVLKQLMAMHGLVQSSNALPVVNIE